MFPLAGFVFQGPEKIIVIQGTYDPSHPNEAHPGYQLTGWSKSVDPPEICGSTRNLWIHPKSVDPPEICGSTFCQQAGIYQGGIPGYRWMAGWGGCRSSLVGGWINPSEKYADRPIKSFPQFFGGKIKKSLKPPPSSLLLFQQSGQKNGGKCRKMDEYGDLTHLPKTQVPLPWWEEK